MIRMKKVYQKHWTTILAVGALLLGGILLRLWFIGLAPQPMIGDQTEYEWYAGKIFSHPYLLASFSFRSYPYSLFLALAYKLVGFGNHQGIFLLQAVLDAGVGFLVYLTIRRALKREKAAWIGFILYTFNPFTSGYVGVVLSEVLSTFFITATILCGVLFVQKPTLLKGLLLGLAAGLTAETRNAAFAWAAIPLGLVFFSFARPGLAKLDVWKYVGAGLVGVLLTVLYPLYVNWRDYKEINITTVDSIFAREFWNGAVFRRLPPFSKNLQIPGLEAMYLEYYSERHPGRTTEERQAIANKYVNKTLAIISADPMDYLRVRLDKMWYVWQKENIFFYEEPGFESHRMVTYWGNIAILAMALLGVLFWPKLQPQKASPFEANFLRWSIIGTMLYGTLAFSITHAEYRLTIPFYPLLILSASVWLDGLGGRA